MTVQRRHDEMHADLTWLIGALARSIHAHCAARPGVLDMLQALAETDFSPANLSPLPRRDAPACHALPLALTQLYGREEEAAQALASCWDHLHWRALTPKVAEAPLVNADGPIVSDGVSLSILLLDEGARHTFPERETRSALFAALLGRAAWRVDDGMRLLMQAPMSLFVQAGHAARCEVERGPALLIALRAAAE